MIEPGRFVLVCALLLGCTSPPPEQRPPPPVPSSEPEPELPLPTLVETTRPAPHPFDRPGPAYLHSGDRLVVLDELEWRPVDIPFTVDARHPIVYLFLGQDGHAYARGWNYVGRLEGDRLEPLVVVDEDRTIVDVAVGRFGELAVQTAANIRGRATVHLLRNGRWSSSSTEQTWPFSTSSAFDNSSNLWLWSAEVERSEWHWPTLTERRVAVELPAPRIPAAFAASPSGEVYMFVDGGFYRISDPEPARFALPGRPAQTAISPNSSIALAWPDCSIARISGEDPVHIESMDADVDCHFEEDFLAIDGRDRIWVGARTSTWVFSPGQPPVEYRMGTVPLLARGVTDIAVVGAGPELPPLGPVRTATLRGSIFVEDAAGGSAGNRALVLRSASNRGKRAREYEFHTSTNERGEFEFADIPIGPYELASEDDKLGWILDSDATRMREGEVLDIGELRGALLAFREITGWQE